MKKRTLLHSVCTLLMFVFLLSASFAEDKTATTMVTSGSSLKKAKYIFLFIGDGMGLAQVYSAELYLNSNGKDPDLENRKKLTFTQFPSVGLATNFCTNSYITDSAAAGTALATGQKTASGVISMDKTKTEKFTTMAEIAKKNGKKVGILSSVSLDHATPACFYAHESGRGSLYNIALQMAESGFDYFAGGGLAGNSPKERNNQKDLFEIFKEKGYTLAGTKADFQKLAKKDNQKIYAFDANLDDAAALYYDIDKKDVSVSLAEFTAKGIELLDNDKGFFMMVEGGKIDWVSHSNDAGAVVKDVIAFDAAIKEAFDFYNKHPEETVIVVTADHETGGMALGYSETKYSTYLEKLNNQKMSNLEFTKIVKKYKETAKPETAKLEDLAADIEKAFGLKFKSADAKDPMLMSEYEISKLDAAFRKSVKNEKVFATDQENYVVYGGLEPITVTLTRIIDNKSGIAFTTYSHTGIPLPVFAIGVERQLFDGYFDNTDIAKNLINMM